MDNNLQHHGVKGMRWGHRKSKPSSEDYVSAHSKKKAREMSDKELRSRISRLQMEQQYKTLSKPRSAAGKKFVTGVLVGTASVVASAYVKKYMESGAKWAGDKIFDVVGNSVIKNLKF